MVRLLFTFLVLIVNVGSALAESTSEKPPHKIGVILGLTGPASTWSQNSLRGLELARDEINSSGGINGRKIELLVEDSRTEPSKSAAAYQKLVNVDRVRVVIGDIW